MYLLFLQHLGKFLTVNRRIRVSRDQYEANASGIKTVRLKVILDIVAMRDLWICLTVDALCAKSGRSSTRNYQKSTANNLVSAKNTTLQTYSIKGN
jgi:hypothetical protein